MRYLGDIRSLCTLLCISIYSTIVPQWAGPTEKNGKDAPCQLEAQKYVTYFQSQCKDCFSETPFQFLKTMSNHLDIHFLLIIY